MAHHAIHSEWPVYKYIYKQATLNQSDYTANIHPNKCGGTVAQHIVLARHTCHSPVDPRAAVLKWSTAEHRWKGSGSGGAREGLDFLALDVWGSMFGREKDISFRGGSRWQQNNHVSFSAANCQLTRRGWLLERQTQLLFQIWEWVHLRSSAP